MSTSFQPFALPDRYRLEGGIASGGMAAVYAAHDTILDRPVAVKVLADHLNDDATARKRFEREARLAAAVSNHVGVVTIFDVGEFNGRAFIVMERREGGTIGDAGRVDHDRALAWLSTVADALDAAHERGVIHRDIKPGNLLLDEHGNVAVADFGIASLVDDTDRFTQTGQVLGTAAYLSPEQACGKSATAASDRYSLAVVAYELLTGEKPFTTANFAAQARAHIEEPPPAAPGLGRQAQDALKRGMAKRAEDRWPTARAFVDALGDALLAAPAVAVPPAGPDVTRRMDPPVPVGVPIAQRTPASVSRRPRAGSVPARAEGAPDHGRRTATFLIAAALALVIVAAGAIALSGGDGDGGNTSAGSGSPTPQQADVKPKPETKKDKAVAVETTAPAPEPTEETASEAPVQATAGDPVALNAEGYDLYLAEDYESAIPLLTGAVEACGDSAELDPCGYAYYNLGSALHRNGQSAEAIPYIEARLERFPEFKLAEVQAELAEARAAAG